jgi:hypothetical protein
VTAALLAGLAIGTFAQETLPTELVLTTKSELEQTYLRDGVVLESGPLGPALESVLIAARRPGGAVFAYGCGEPAEAPLSIPSTYSVASALDTLTSIYPTHSWTVRDGVINLLPRQGLPTVLGTPIEHLAWDTNEAPSASVGRLFRLDAVTRRFVALGITGGMIIPGLRKLPRLVDGIPQVPKGREWKVENVTLLAALNRIAASYGDARWVYEESTCGAVKSYRVWAH